MITKRLTTSTFDVAGQLRNPGEMALYLDACIVESDGDTAVIAKALNDIARARRLPSKPD